MSPPARHPWHQAPPRSQNPMIPRHAMDKWPSGNLRFSLSRQAPILRTLTLVSLRMSTLATLRFGFGFGFGDLRYSMSTNLVQREDVFGQPGADLGNHLSHFSAEVWLRRFSKNTRGHDRHGHDTCAYTRSTTKRRRMLHVGYLRVIRQGLLHRAF